jgi:hypothetical protein
MAGVMATAAALPAVRLGDRSYPVVLPGLRDPRLHVALVIGTLQVLGQTVLGFELSVAQILVCLGMCAAVEVGVAMWRDRVLLWPASALLTGNSVALLLRTTGTRHGDWWSLSGIEVFLFACAVSMGSKYLLRRRGRHVFNPSNLGLVAAFILFGTQRANPQDLWWGALSPGLWVTLGVIVGGGVAIVRRLRMVGLVVAFWVAFAACVGVVAASGHCITARWRYGAVCGGEFWSVMTTSPEVLVFLFFMITDPRTAPREGASGAGVGPRTAPAEGASGAGLDPPAAPRRGVARVAYGTGVGFVAALLSAPARTEFATKVAVLGALVVVCGAMPLGGLVQRVRIRRPAFAGPAAALAMVGALLAASIPARTAAAPAPLPSSHAAPPASALPSITVSPDAQQTAGLDPATARAAVAAAMQRAPAQSQITRATVLLLRNPARPQDPPQLGVELRGTTATGAPFARDYAVAAAADRWVVTAEQAPR